MQEASSQNHEKKNSRYLEYPHTLGDKGLEWLKKLLPSAELRHNFLPIYAQLLSYFPYKGNAPAIEKILQFKDRSLPLRMSSPIILAAGANKSGEALPNFHALGLGGISVGSVTSTSRLGNPHRPRVSLLEQDFAMQNAMGLNNPGVDIVASRVDHALAACHKHAMVLGLSVAETPEIEDMDERIDDLLISFRKAYKAADYIEINASCPNTGTNRMDEEIAYLSKLLEAVSRVRKSLVPRKAVFLKLSPDMNARTLEQVLDIVDSNNLTGLVLFNTFPSSKARFLKLSSNENDLLPLSESGHKGGISGKPLYQNTLPAVQFIKKALPNLSIMACGGVDHGAKVLELLEAGADAVQCYTVLAYRQNAIRRMNRELLTEMKRKSLTSLNEDKS